MERWKEAMTVNGNILRIQGVRSHQRVVPCLSFSGLKHVGLSEMVLFRCVVKIVQGSGISLVCDYPLRPPMLTKVESDASPEGWHFFETRVVTSHITNFDHYHAFHMEFMGEQAGGVGPFEVYIAMPFVANIDRGSKSVTLNSRD